MFLFLYGNIPETEVDIEAGAVVEYKYIIITHYRKVATGYWYFYFGYETVIDVASVSQTTALSAAAVSVAPWCLAL